MNPLIKSKAIYIILATIIVVTMMCIVSIASSKHDKTAYQWGQLEQQHQENTKKGDPVIVADHFTIYSDELTLLTEKLSLIHPDNASDIAAETLIEKYALFYKAQDSGLVVSDSQVETIIQEQIKIFSEVESEDYDVFLAGLGMTNEEYWHSRKEELIITESIAAWKEQQYQEFALSHGPDVDQQKWEMYFDELKNSIIDKENVHYINN